MGWSRLYLIILVLSAKHVALALFHAKTVFSQSEMLQPTPSSASSSSIEIILISNLFSCERDLRSDIFRQKFSFFSPLFRLESIFAQHSIRSLFSPFQTFFFLACFHKEIINTSIFLRFARRRSRLFKVYVALSSRVG